jgi:beta-lactamase regulating signal transducer with metallopeptidase domain
MIAALLDHLWQSTLFAGAVTLLVPLFRRQSASLRYWLWFTASMKFLFPFALLTMLGRHTVSAVTPAIGEQVLAAIRPAAVPFVAIAAPAPTHIPAIDLAAAVWCAGLAAIALMCLSRWLDLRATLRDADPLPLIAPVPVKSAPSFLEPGLVGIWRPVILLPVGLTQHLTPAELEAVLAHELCHLHRRDNLLASLHMMVEGLFWFHPLVWWIGSRLCEERERACDESVVAGGARPLVYAEGILKTCRFYVQSPLACASGVSGADLKLRVRAIVAGQPIVNLHPAKAMLLALAGTAAVMLPLSAGLLGSSLLGSSPGRRIAAHLTAVLAAQEMHAPSALPSAPAPDFTVAHRKRRAAAVTYLMPPPGQANMSMIVRMPTIRIDTVLDTHLPAIAAPVSPEPEDAVVCRKPQQLVNSRLAGPEVCLHASQWNKLRADGLDVGPDGKNIIRADYEKQKSLLGTACPPPPIPGATSGWSGGFAACF